MTGRERLRRAFRRVAGGGIAVAILLGLSLACLVLLVLGALVGPVPAGPASVPAASATPSGP